MSIQNNKTATELFSLILSLMDDDDRAELRAAMGKDNEPEDEPALCNDPCFECPDRDTCSESPLQLDDDYSEDEDEDDDELTIEATISNGMYCIMMGGTDDELPLAIELIKKMGLVSPAPAPAKSRVRGEMVNRNQNVPEGSISGQMIRHLISGLRFGTMD